MNPIQIPILLKATKTCNRCGCHYLKKRAQCPHCATIADGPALDAFKAARARKKQANVELGKRFMWFAFSLGLILLVAVTLL